jgi:tRNA1Val (adenine37-N6)-methyltransferase
MTTTETIFQGHLKILQKKKGYRFSIDAAILAHHVTLEKASVAVDLGTGCGVIPLILAGRFPLVHIYGIEIQKDLARLAETNVQINNMADRVTIICGDMKDATAFVGSEKTDVVFSNPPYGRLRSGRLSPNGERAKARHEITASLADVMSSAERLLRPSGRLILIYAAGRTADLITQMRAFKLEPKKLRWIHAKKDSPAELVLVEGTKHGGSGVTVAPPLVLHEEDGSFTTEVKKMVEG